MYTSPYNYQQTEGMGAGQASQFKNSKYFSPYKNMNMNPGHQQQQSMQGNYTNLPPKSVQQSPMPHGGMSGGYQNKFGTYNLQEQDNLGSNLMAGAQISELEMLLEAERRKFKESKDRSEQELQNERKLRIDYENKLMSLKQESQQRDIDISEMQFKNSNTQQENISLQTEMKSLREEMMRMQDLYNHKINQLDQQSQKQQQHNQQMENKYRLENEQMKKYYEEQFEGFSKQKAFELKGVEDKCRNLMQIKSDLENEIRQLNDNIMRIKVEAEEEMRDRMVRVQEEEYRKYTGSLRAIEQKLRAVEDSKENAVKKNAELLKELQARDYILNDQQTTFDQEVTRFKSQLAEQQNQLNQHQMMREKAKYELQLKETQLSKVEAEFQEMHGHLQRQRDETQQLLREQDEKFRKLKMQNEEIQSEQARKLQQMESYKRQLEAENERVRTEYDRITSVMQNNINRTISQTISENFNFRPNDLPQKPQYGFTYN